MDVRDSLLKAKEMNVWLHGQTNNISLPSDKRSVIAASLFQQALDVCDGIVILVSNNLPGPALALARPMHEGYVRGVWILQHATEESVDKFEAGKCPKFPELLKQIGEEPGTSGAFIKGMTDLNLPSFHDLTHGGMEHVHRRVTATSIEPNYSDVEILSLIKVRNQYSMLITCFLLLMADDSSSIEELIKKREEWNDFL